MAILSLLFLHRLVFLTLKFVVVFLIVFEVVGFCRSLGVVDLVAPRAAAGDDIFSGNLFHVVFVFLFCLCAQD